MEQYAATGLGVLCCLLAGARGAGRRRALGGGGGAGDDHPRRSGASPTSTARPTPTPCSARPTPRPRTTSTAIEMNYLTALGRTAEAEGEAAIWTDLRRRLFIDPEALKADYAASPPWLMALMDAWADGLNAYLAAHPEVHPKVITPFRAVDGALLHRGQHRRRQRAGGPRRAARPSTTARRRQESAARRGGAVQGAGAAPTASPSRPSTLGERPRPAADQPAHLASSSAPSCR